MTSSGDLPGVLLLGNHAPPYGGVPNHVGHLARHLSAKGWRVHVMSDTSLRRGSYRVGDYWVHAPTTREKLRNLAQLPPRPALRSARRSLSEPSSYLADIARANLAQRLVRAHNLSVMSSYHILKPGISAAWVSETTGVPLLTTIFGEIFDKPELHRRRLRDVQYIFDRSAAVLSCSRHCATSAESVLGLQQDVGVLYYGVDTERFGAATVGADERARFAVTDDHLVVVFVARMVAEMGLDVLLDSIPALLERQPRARVLVAGSVGPLTARAQEVAAAAAPGRVTVHPDVPDADLPTLYALADVVAAPSNNARACLGLAIAEAMSARRPVVACSVGGTAEVVVDGVTGTLVPPDDPVALMEGLLGYLGDGELRQRHGTAGRARALERFDVGITNDRCEKLFRQVVSGQPAAIR